MQGVAGLSEDASRIYFVARGVLSSEPRGGVGGGCFAELTPAELTEEETGDKEGKCRPKKGAENLYVADTVTGTPRLSRRSPRPTRCSGTPVGSFRTNSLFEAEAPRPAGPMNVTGDGRFLVFTSAADVTSDDTSTVAQVFRYDADTEALVRVSIGNEGFNDDGNSNVGAARKSRASRENAKEHSIGRSSASRRRRRREVVFTSSAALTPGRH